MCVVAEIMEVMREMQIQSNSQQQQYPQVDAKQQEIENLEDALAHIMANSCSQFCQSGEYGDGTVIGTAPFCDGVCGRDCSTHCTIANSDWDDYGNPCWFGNKICCCGESPLVNNPQNNIVCTPCNHVIHHCMIMHVNI